MHFPLLQHLIANSTGNTFALSFAIVLGTFLLEDPTTIIVGVLAADGIIPFPLALLSLYFGIFAGDIGLYLFGWLASRSPRVGHYVDHELLAPFRAWLETRYILTIFSARFIPGARIPTYAASGFFRSPLSTFIFIALIATSIWTTVLFFASYWFGNATTHWIGLVRWGIAIAFLVILFFVGRHNVLAYRTKKDAASAESSLPTR